MCDENEIFITSLAKWIKTNIRKHCDELKNWETRIKDNKNTINSCLTQNWTYEHKFQSSRYPYHKGIYLVLFLKTRLANPVANSYSIESIH